MWLSLYSKHQQVSQQLHHGVQMVTIGQSQLMCLRTSQLKMLASCLHWHC